jgi:putative ABC transport system permease protein
MLWNNIMIALRNLRKNKAFAAINISGLALGLTIYIFGGLLVEYENTHDQSYANVNRIYTIGSTANPELNVGVDKFNSTFMAVAPIIKAELSDIDAVARTRNREYLLTSGAESYYEGLRFADPELLTIFDFNYIHGDSSALDDPSGLLITETIAIKYFGNTDAIGEVLTFDNEYDFSVTAVIEDPPLNTHFNSLVIADQSFGIVAPIRALNRLIDYDADVGDWNNLSLGDMTYVLLPENLDQAWLQSQADRIYDTLVPEDEGQAIASLDVHPLSYANVAIWDMIGMPVIVVISLLSLMVLIVACVNYTNLATAQSLGRTREVGMRKTMGATQIQLLTQFLVESLVIAAIAMIFAIAALEMVIPLFNNAAGKNMTLDYMATMPWLLMTTVLVGLFAGLYPAWLITRTNPIEALRDIARKGKKGSRVRSFMIGAQFAISAFMLAMVTIVYLQNEKVKSSSYIFPRSEIYVVDRLNVDGISDKLETLRHELEALPNVDSVAFSSQVPYEQNNSQNELSPIPGDEAAGITLMNMRMSPEFLDAYDIPVLAGRNLSHDITNDKRTDELESLNILVNELTLAKMGIDKPIDAINQRLYPLDEASTLREYVIVGVVPTQNIVGLFNEEKAWFYQYSPSSLRIGSVRITGGNIMDSVEAVEDVWDRVIPDYPIQGRFLDAVFDDVYNVLKYMNMALGIFAFVALSLALIGLFGLAAFMATQRTKEIGVRKVLGASTTQIARLLVWQFSTPVLWALLVALPGAYFATQGYLNFFADRIESPIPILIVSGLTAVLLAWGTIAGHAIRIARSNPIRALRYE